MQMCLTNDQPQSFTELALNVLKRHILSFAELSDINVRSASRVWATEAENTVQSVGWLNYHLWTRCIAQRPWHAIAILITHIQAHTL